MISDWTARFDALKSGQVDIINRVDPKAGVSLEKSTGLKLVRAVGGYHVVAAMQVDKAPYDNPDLRMALKFAVDREQIARALFNGYGAIGNDHPVRPTDPFFNSELPQRRHDPERAAFYFRRSGLADPKIILQVAESAFDGAGEMAQLMQASCGVCGIKMDIKKEPADGYWDNVWLKGPYVASYWSGRAAAAEMLSIAYGAGSPLNETHWKNERFEKLLLDAKSEVDDARRRPYIWEMQKMLHDEGGAIIPVFRDWLDARNDRVGGDAPTGGLGHGERLYPREGVDQGVDPRLDGVRLKGQRLDRNREVKARRAGDDAVDEFGERVRRIARVFEEKRGFFGNSGYTAFMKREEVLQKLKAAQADLRARGVAHAALFGSVARGEDRSDSDIDIMVEIAPGTPIGVFQYIGIVHAIEDLFPVRVDVSNRLALKPHVRPSAEREAIYAF